jgi:hypothetical protein
VIVPWYIKSLFVVFFYIIRNPWGSISPFYKLDIQIHPVGFCALLLLPVEGSIEAKSRRRSFLKGAYATPYYAIP